MLGRQGGDDACVPPQPVPALSTECVGWIRTANYRCEVADDSIMMSSQVGAATRYFIRRRGADRLELSKTEDLDDIAHVELFVADVMVLERYLYGIFGDDIREDLGLPFLDLPCSADDLASGYELGAMARGYRTLSRVGGAPVAAAPDPTLSLVALVPLSHYLRWSFADLKRSFLSPEGKPLLRDGRYAPEETTRPEPTGQISAEDRQILGPRRD